MEITVQQKDYKQWLIDLKEEIKHSQVKASVQVNKQLIILYWNLGRKIVQKQKTANWGDGFINRLSEDLMQEFPNFKGLTAKNLRQCRQFYLFYSQNDTIWTQPVSKLENESKTAIWKQPAAELEDLPVFNIPWGHNILIMQRCKELSTALFYVRKTIENNWSRSMLDYNLQRNLIKHQGTAITNFKNTLPAYQSDLANEIIKDEYNFDFLNLSQKARERDLETQLVNHITQFLLELGQGFAYMGRQFLLKVGNKEYRTDLLFYHTKLKCYIVIELKVKEFEPEFIGKLSFYTSAINRLIKDDKDNATIGILLCRGKDDFEVEIALQDINKPIGVSTYTYNNLPKEVKPSLKAIDTLQKELNSIKL